MDTSDYTCGIYYLPPDLSPSHYFPTPLWLPIISLSAHVSICHISSRVKLKQTFSSLTDPIVEAAYSFPLYEGASVVGFNCKIGNRTIRGFVQEREKARKTYEAAIDRGESAGLLVQNSSDVWSTKIGNIPAGEHVEVEIEYVCELKHDTQVDGIRFVLPTVIGPKYGDPPANVAPSMHSESRGIAITVVITMTSSITSVQSPSHPIAVGIGTHTIDPSPSPDSDDFDVCKAHAKLSQESSALDKDFVLMVVAAQIGQPQAIVETHPTLPHHRAIMLSLVPRFQLPSIKPEIVFVADRSGSMEDKMPQLRKALTIFLKSLPVGVKFNLCSFGSDHSFLWPKSMPYNQGNLDIALRHVENFDADYGGTHMFAPIEAALNQRYKDLPTEILVLTDGEIWNSQGLFDLVQRECKSGEVRVFSLGIGDSVSHALLEGLARAGRGYAQVVGREDSLDAKVVRMLKSALGVHILENDLQLHYGKPTASTSLAADDEDFEILEHDGTTTRESDRQLPSTLEERKNSIPLSDPSDHSDENVQSTPGSEDKFSHLQPLTVPARLQIPYDIAPPYPFTRTTVFILLSSNSEMTPESLTLSYTTASGEKLELNAPITVVETGTTLHQLAARKLIRELEEGNSYLHSGRFGIDPLKNERLFGDWVERESVRIGITYGVAGKWTRFVAVDSSLDKQQCSYDQAESEEEDFHACMMTFGSASHTSTSKLRRVSLANPNSPFLELESIQCSLDEVDYSFAFQPTSTTTTPSLNSDSHMTGSASSDPDVHISEALYEDSSTPIAFRLDLDLSPALDSCQQNHASGPVIGDIGEQDISAFGPTSPRSPVPLTDEDMTYELITRQSFDGSFSCGVGSWAAETLDAFAKWIEAEDKQQQQQEMASLRALPREQIQQVVATAVAVAIFQSRLQNLQNVWEMVAQKANGWGAYVAGESAWALITTWADGQVAKVNDHHMQTFFSS